MPKEHRYQISLKWTENKNKGTENYQVYDRIYEIKIDGKPIIQGSSDPYFQRDRQTT